ncbi:MAG: hypothetical protein WC438_06430 [Candidatus Pacearchaeota archaeon]
MKIKDLIQQLQKYEPNMLVFLTSDMGLKAVSRITIIDPTNENYAFNKNSEATAVVIQ